MAVEIKIEKRDTTKKPRVLRSEGTIPATLYGPEIDPQAIQLNAKEFSRVNFHDYTHLINLKNDAEEHEALIKNIQRDFVTRDVLNIEFYKVKRGHKVTMKVELKFTGTSQAVKTGADLVVIHKEANIKCLPKDIPYFLEVDISKLTEVGTQMTFADLVFDREKIELLEPAKEVICKAEAKRTNVVETTAPAEAAEGEAAEGAEAAPAEGEAAKAAE
jgi:large subunit ribosomal protein L25